MKAVCFLSIFNAPNSNHLFCSSYEFPFAYLSALSFRSCVSRHGRVFFMHLCLCLLWFLGLWDFGFFVGFWSVTDFGFFLVFDPLEDFRLFVFFWLFSIQVGEEFSFFLIVFFKNNFLTYSYFCFHSFCDIFLGWLSCKLDLNIAFCMNYNHKLIILKYYLWNKNRIKIN